jgi:hypothetical protein
LGYALAGDAGGAACEAGAGGAQIVTREAEQTLAWIALVAGLAVAARIAGNADAVTAIEAIGAVGTG